MIMVRKTKWSFFVRLKNKPFEKHRDIRNITLQVQELKLTCIKLKKNMKFQIKINSFITLEEVSNYWTTADYIQLLDLFGFPDGESADKESLKDLLMMAITDHEPNEAAAILLAYKLSDDLSKGQIDQISNDMLLDKIAEEYPESHLHGTRYHINPL